MSGSSSGAIGYLSVILAVILLTLAPASLAQDLPPCGLDRPTTIDIPWTDLTGCLEHVLRDTRWGEAGLAQLTAADDGSLYATAPHQGQVVHITDTNNDALPDTATVILDNLIYPTGITFHEGRLYISDQQRVIVVDAASGSQRTLIDTLPWGITGYPTGNALVADERLIIGVGGDATCTNTERGAVYSFALDGTDRQTLARGILAPADLALFNGALWAVDTATDRLLRLEPGTDYGACSSTSPDNLLVYPFEPGSAPVALAATNATELPNLDNTLLVGLRGSIQPIQVTGYKLVRMAFDDQGHPVDSIDLVPAKPPERSISLQRMNLQESGLYPHHLYGVAVDANGWVYLSAGGGWVMGLRPR